MSSSSHLNWLIIRNNNSFLLKKRDVKKPFSTESNNLTNVSSYRYSGLVHKKTVGVVPSVDQKGFVVVLKKGKNAQKPVKNTVRIKMTAGPRRSLKKLRHLLVGNKYRKDLTQAAVRRASAIIRSQKTSVQTKKVKKN